MFTLSTFYNSKRKINDKKVTRRFNDSCHHYQMRRKLALNTQADSIRAIVCSIFTPQS